jgi:8-oxo-dGTP pyrophosphatase MutT (NUDIX family)
MRLSEIYGKITKSIPDNLPGFDAQLKMSPPFRGNFEPDKIFQYNPMSSAVLILLYPKQNDTHLVFIERMKDGRAHSGQIAFPGGKKDESDTSLVETALREAEEEIGIERNKVEVVGELSSLYVPVSNFIIQPVVAICESELCFVPQPTEVRGLIEAPLQKFEQRQNVVEITIENKMPTYSMKVPAFKVYDHFIWGATAMIMSEFLEILER